jgi:hypothetical protein
VALTKAQLQEAIGMLLDNPDTRKTLRAHLTKLDGPEPTDDQRQRRRLTEHEKAFFGLSADFEPSPDKPLREQIDMSKLSGSQLITLGLIEEGSGPRPPDAA